MRPTRLSLAALAFAVSCSALVPTATPNAADRSAAPSPSAPGAGLGGAPVVTPVAATATPSRTVSTPSGAAVGAPTPRPALGLPVTNAPCVEWPNDVAVVMTQLPLPASICLVRTTSASVGRLVCTVIGCVPVTKGCDEDGQCLQILDGTSPHYVLVFIHPPASPPTGEIYTITRVLCRLHQYRSLSDIMLPGAPPPVGGWLSTVEAREFATAFAGFRIGYAADAERWKPQSTDFENYADVCAAWYAPDERPQRVSDYASLLTFAKKWLPVPQ